MNITVIKIGGSVLENLENLLTDIPDRDVIIVHGGGKEVTRVAERMGKEQRFIVSPDGYRSRYTDQETIQIYQMVIAGRINKDIVRILTRLRRRSIGICGLDSGLIRAKRKKWLIMKEEGRKKMIEGGYTGKITEVNTEFLQILLDNKIIPVIGALAIGEEFEPLNVDADRVVAAISRAMDIEKIVFFTDQDGILDSNGKTIPQIRKSQLSKIKVGFGMKEKILGCMEAQTKQMIIANGLRKNPFTSIRGTVIENE